MFQTQQPMIPSNKITRMNVVKLIIRETGTYNNQYLRPYASNVDMNAVAQVVHRATTNNVAKITADQLCGVTGGILGVSSHIESTAPVPIAGGWGDKRMLFLLSVRCEFQSGGVQLYYIQGYTDYVGVSYGSGSVDKNLMFYVNNIVTMREQTRRTPMGVVTQPVMIANQHVVFDQGEFDIKNPKQKSLIRPVDVYNNLAGLDMVSNAGSGATVYGTGNSINAIPKMSRRSNAVGTEFAANIINGFLGASSQATLSDNPQAIFATAAGMVDETNPYQNAFMARLSEYNTTQSVSGIFKFRDLVALDPGFEHPLSGRMTVVRNALGQEAQVHQSGHTAHWHGSGSETRWAFTIGHAIPSLMMSNMIASVKFISTNMEKGVPDTVISAGAGFSDVDMSRNFMTLVAQFETSVLRDLTYDNQLSYFISVQSNVAGETRITVSINGNQSEDYVMPTFCDGMMAPVITGTRDASVQISQDIQQLVSIVNDEVSMHTTPNHRTFSSLPPKLSIQSTNSLPGYSPGVLL